MEWNRMEFGMDYKIKDVCSTLGFGSSSFYKRLNLLKECIYKNEENEEDYFYKTGNKFFITEKGFNWFKHYNEKEFCKNKYNSKSIDSINNALVALQNQTIDEYKKRIEYLENENKRLTEIIAVKEQKELAQNIKYIDNKSSEERQPFYYKFLNIFKK